MTSRDNCLKFYEYSRHQAGRWLCKCACGKEKVVLYGSLKYGRTKSCGCYMPENSARKATKHGMHGLPAYNSWMSMKSRCNNAKFRYYYGRGIKYCKRWEYFMNFYADMGDRPNGKTLDRIDPNGDYSPDNCRWADMITQMNNTRKNRFISFRGKTQTVSQWGRELGINQKVISDRINKYKWTVEKSLTQPIKRR